jgi:hypothetical protein
MKKTVSLGSLALLVALFAFLFTSTSSASAHGDRMVGPYAFIVGFLNEPVYAGQVSGLDLTICNGDCVYTVKDGTKVISNPVNDADKALKAEVTMGAAAPLPLTLEARYGQPGKYAGYFTPSKEGDYTFHITGTLGSTKVDEKFASSKDGFSAIAAGIQYPSVQVSGDENSALKSQVNDLQNSLGTARTIGIAGIVAGVLGLALAGFALARKPRVAVASSADDAPVDSLRG